MNKTMALFFYEQCAGTSTGHMAMIPNSPVLFSLIKSRFLRNDNTLACSRTEFAKMLREIADDLEGIKS